MDKKRRLLKKKATQPEVEARKVTAVKAEEAEAVFPTGSSAASGGELRKHAEKIARKKAPDVPESLEGMSPAEASNLLHELRVHQIELEMQNEELRTAQERLEEARARYFELYDVAPVGYFTISEKGIILEANLTSANLLGVLPRELRAQPLGNFIFKDDRDVFYLRRKQLFETLAPQACEFRMVRSKGSIFWARMEATVAQDGKSGKPVCRMALSDVTLQKQSGDELKYSVSLLNASLESTADGLLIVDRQGKIARWNQRFADMWEIQEKVLASRDDEKSINHILAQLAHPEQFVSKVRKLYGQPEESSFDQIEFLDGRVFERYSQPQRIGGDVVGRVWSFRDITERKHIEDALRRREREFSTLVENAPDMIVRFDTDLRHVYCNRTVEKQMGRPLDAFIGKTPAETGDSPEQSQFVEKSLRQTLKTGEEQIVEQSYPTPSGIKYFQTRIVPERDDKGKIESLLAMTRDITVRKRAEEALTQSRDLITNLARLVPGVIYQYQLYPDGRSAFPYSSPGMYDIYEVTPEEVREDATAVFGRLHPDDYDRVADTIQESARTLQIFYCEFRVILPRQGLRWRWSQAHPERMVDGGTLWHGIISDITERKQAEEALREEGWRLQSIIEGTHAGTWEWNVQTGETVFNETWAQITGYTLDELSPISIKTWEALVHPDDLKQSDELLERHFSGELPNYDCECRMKHKDGHWVWVHDRGRIVTRTADGKPLMMFGSHSDITDRKQLEEEKERIEKLEAVGRLAGGIAHDFNNTLTAILGNISLARMDAAPGSELSVSLEQAEKASLRAKDLTVQLLTFSKGGAPVKKLGPLTELLRDTAGFALTGSKVKCKFSIPADLWPAEIDAGQVSQVIRNLVVNAQQAMPAGGTIEISAENLALTEKQSSGMGLPLKAGNYVRIAIADHGRGIPADHLKKIFEPFFTTRPKSSGMGLATSFSIVRQHGGYLSVESKAGSGSTFYIYLPTSMESAAAKQDKIEAANRIGKARILVMDDEKTVREIAGRMLKHIGYADIEFATDGIEAIKLYKAAMESGNPFVMAILDLTIPGGMGGEITIRNLLKIDPAVKAIVSSGYVDDPVMAEYNDYGFSGMVAKPYTIAELRKAVQDVTG